MKTITSALLGLALLAAPAMAGVTTIAAVRVTDEADLAASPAEVWSWMTQGKNLVTWCPVWKSPANAKVTLARVGDSLDFTDEWGNGGRSVVTFLEAPRELRVVHEPLDGSYICQGKITLTAGPAGTHVRWVEQYTDESPPSDRDATAAKMADEIRAALVQLQKSFAGRR